jgi:hypothetical protein
VAGVSVLAGTVHLLAQPQRAEQKIQSYARLDTSKSSELDGVRVSTFTCRKLQAGLGVRQAPRASLLHNKVLHIFLDDLRARLPPVCES